jgi:putative transposase
MNRKISFSIDEYYHVYNRGTDKRIIFNDEHDYKRFTALLYLCNGTASIDLREHFSEGRTFVDLFSVNRGEKIVDIGGYCLMPNHFHLILREITEGGISLFMKKIGTAYAMYFNGRNERTGALFEGKFKARHANTDEYLKYLFAYVHLNPVKLIDSEWKERGIADLEKTKDYLNQYSYSSYYDFLGKKRLERVILSKESFPGYFETENDFDDYINDWLTYNEKFTEKQREEKQSQGSQKYSE